MKAIDTFNMFVLLQLGLGLYNIVFTFGNMISSDIFISAVCKSTTDLPWKESFNSLALHHFILLWYNAYFKLC